ncbi:MAG: hypothetical protein QNJ55_19495 [Xenococcus sp. MO_188.B8]|nr:hypothetical protein [Xenococcus sp. MO_188.B8]
MERRKALNDIEDIDKLATKPPQKAKKYQENFIKEKSYKATIANSQESTKGSSAIIIILISIYGVTIFLCFAIIGFGLAPAERREILTLIITSQAILIGTAIGFYFGKKQ